jgi:hypothetical protein
MKKWFSFLLTALMVLGISSAAYASNDFTVTDVTLNSIGVDGTDADGHGIKYVTNFPADIPIGGTISFSSTDNTDPTIRFNIYINDKKIPGSNVMFIKNYPFTYSFSGVWTVYEPGTYTVRITAQQAGDDISDEETVCIKLVTVTYPAAPAVAAELLKNAGISPKYGSGKQGGNYISDVATLMGPTTLFKGVPKSEVSAYRTEVANYLISRGLAVTP